MYPFLLGTFEDGCVSLVSQTSIPLRKNLGFLVLQSLNFLFSQQRRGTRGWSILHNARIQGKENNGK